MSLTVNEKKMLLFNITIGLKYRIKNFANILNNEEEKQNKIEELICDFANESIRDGVYNEYKIFVDENYNIALSTEEEAQEQIEKEKNKNIKYTTTNNKYECFECDICYLNKTNNKLNCNHNFCSGCIGEWLKNHNTCPMCRSSINEIEIYKN